MIYEQILKDSRSLGEGSVRFICTRKDFESFLKQSFIKYLKGQIEEYEKDIREELEAKANGEVEETAEWYKVRYIKDKITALQAQIKELEV